MLISALFTIAKTWKQPECPSRTDKGWNRGTDKDVVHIYNRIFLSRKKNEIMPFAATWMMNLCSSMWVTLKMIILSEVSQIKTNIP